MAKRAYVQLTPKQRNEIMAALDASLITKGNGFFKFAGIDNDKSIAVQLGVSESQVRSIRGQFFGKLEPSHDFVKYGELISRVKQLELTIEGMSKTLLDLSQRGPERPERPALLNPVVTPHGSNGRFA